MRLQKRDRESIFIVYVFQLRKFAAVGKRGSLGSSEKSTYISVLHLYLYCYVRLYVDLLKSQRHFTVSYYQFLAFFLTHIKINSYLADEEVSAFAEEGTKRNTLYSFIHGGSPDGHFDIVFFVTGTNSCCFFSLYLIHSRLISKNCAVENNL